MGEQGNLLRLWVMPTQEVPSSGWADLWVCCALRFGHRDWWHQGSGRVGGTWLCVDTGWSWGVTFSQTPNHHLDGHPRWTLILVLPILAWPGCPMEASFPLPTISAHKALFYLISSASCGDVCVPGAAFGRAHIPLQSSRIPGCLQGPESCVRAG